MESIRKHILKIESETGGSVFLENATQEIELVDSSKLRRNLDFNMIIDTNRKNKYRTIIAAEDIPKNIMRFGELFTIYSITKVRQKDKPQEMTNDYTEVCPVFKMILTGYKYKASTNNNPYWHLEFEEP
ncbi:hypothetical protein FACS1894113_2470 [Alphaproteobacteria bacterium]|nr:hypothetical protein FACS1894113_2470 [Alphaproteobacteria bacterium]